MSARAVSALRDERGASAVEFALVAPLFIAMTFAILQLGIVFFAKSELQSATEKAARLVFTAQTSTTYNSPASFRQALCANLTVVIQCGGVMISLTPQASLSAVSTAAPTLSYDANGNVTNSFNYNAGAPNQIMVLQVLYQLPVVGGPIFNLATQANGSLLLVATVVFQNEPS